MVQEFAETGSAGGFLSREATLIRSERLLLRRTASAPQEGLGTVVLDISGACLYAKVKRAQCIDLPVADEVSTGERWLES